MVRTRGKLATTLPGGAMDQKIRKFRRASRALLAVAMLSGLIMLTCFFGLPLQFGIDQDVAIGISVIGAMVSPFVACLCVWGAVVCGDKMADLKRQRSRQ